MPTFTPWIWSAAHESHYSYLLSDDDNRILQTFWSGPIAPRHNTPAAGSAQGLTRSSPTSPPQPTITTRSSGGQDHKGKKDRIPIAITKGKEIAPAVTFSAPFGHGKRDDDEDSVDDDEDESEVEANEEGDVDEEGSEEREDNVGNARHVRSDSAQRDLFTVTRSMRNMSMGSAAAHPQEANPTQIDGPMSFQYQAARQKHPYDSFPSALAVRSTVSSLPVDVQQDIRFSDRRYIQTGSDLNLTEKLDTRFRRVAKHHHNDFFTLGRVFRMLWTEPAGQSNPGRTRNSTHFSVVWLDEKAYSEIRIFVVVRNKGSFSQCIPIQTYGKKGATKAGLVMRDHGIIHTSQTTPTPLSGEFLTKFSIRVIPNRNEALDPCSRVNYGKAYAVEHNVKVLDIGMVESTHRYMIECYFETAMKGE